MQPYEGRDSGQMLRQNHHDRRQPSSALNCGPVEVGGFRFGVVEGVSLRNDASAHPEALLQDDSMAAPSHGAQVKPLGTHLHILSTNYGGAFNSRVQDLMCFYVI